MIRGLIAYSSFLRLSSLACRSLLAALIMAMVPSTAMADSRLQERLYNPDEVVTIHGRTKVQATITFGEDETIENIAIGDSSAWQVTPNKRANLLFVKPLTTSAATNMTVVTNKHTYLFDLVSSTRNRPLYVLKFTYQKPVIDPNDQAQLAAVEEANAIEMAAAKDPYAVVDPARLNFEWIAKGDPELLPSRTYDDGEATFLHWPEGNSVPAILISNSEGVEGPVNYTVRGDTVVVQGVPRAIVLRIGDDSATLTNTGPDRSAQRRQDAVLAQTTEAL